MLLERCDGSAPLQRTGFLQECWGQSAGRTDRATDHRNDRPGGQRNTKSALLLQKEPGTVEESCRECQCANQTAALLWLFWLAKHSISFLIMISRVIIYTKAAHSLVLRRQGSSLLPLVKGKAACCCVLLKMNAGEELTEKQSGMFFITCLTANAIKCWCHWSKKVRSLTC